MAPTTNDMSIHIDYNNRVNDPTVRHNTLIILINHLAVVRDQGAQISAAAMNAITNLSRATPSLHYFFKDNADALREIEAIFDCMGNTLKKEIEIRTQSLIIELVRKLQSTNEHWKGALDQTGEAETIINSYLDPLPAPTSFTSESPSPVPVRIKQESVAPSDSPEYASANSEGSDPNEDPWDSHLDEELHNLKLFHLENNTLANVPEQPKEFLPFEGFTTYKAGGEKDPLYWVKILTKGLKNAKQGMRNGEAYPYLQLGPPNTPIFVGRAKLNDSMFMQPSSKKGLLAALQMN